jgi:octaprenyl-diphosphate synthase
MRKEEKHLRQFFRPVGSDLKRFDSLLDTQLHADSTLIQSVLDYILEKKGKRIRPTFLFLTARCSGMAHSRMIEAALAIELIHTATLLHDDVVDESDRRRGKKTVNSNWTNVISILMGDFLFAKSFRLLVRTGSPKLINRVSLTTERVSFGELRQIEECGNYDITEDAYLDIITAKTASLFSTSAASGAVLSDVPAREVNRLARFGEGVGISFQIADDLLDLIGDSTKTGKDAGNDLMQGKITLPLIYALRKSSQKVRTEITGILSNGTKPSHYKKVIDFIGNAGGIEYARQRAEHFGTDALKLIRKYGQSRYQTALENVVRFTVNREN